MRKAGHVARMGEWRGAYRFLVGKSEGTIPLGRPRLGYKRNIKMDLQKVDGELWTGLIWLRVGTGSGHF